MTRIEEVSDDMLMALADNELPEPQATAVRALVMANPDLQRRFDVFAETRRMLQDAFPPEPVPMSLVQTILEADAAPSDRIVPFKRRAPILSPGWGAAMAASLVIATGAGSFFAGRSLAPAQVASGPEAAAVALASVPTGGQAMLPDGSTARALASYDTDLGLCRLISTEASRAVACRDGEDWKVALSVAATGEGAFLPASELGTALIDQLLDDIAASTALDLSQEQEALAP